MADFTQQIKNFTTYGTYNYLFDQVGNEVLNPSSSVFQQVYFALPLKNYLYNGSKILQFYDPTFTEFVPAASQTSSISTFPQEAIDQINQITAENQQLLGQLDAVVAASTQMSASADAQSVRDTILQLRISLGQGQSANDFDTTFPYLPIPLENT